MNWKYKALSHVLFSHIPCGSQVNYFCQRYVTKSLPNSDATIRDIVKSAKEHISAFEKYSRRSLGDAKLYEFGAGVTMAIPIAFYAFGVNRQVVVDITRLARPWLIQNTIDRFQRMAQQLEVSRTPTKRIHRSQNFFASLEEYYGVDYRAPLDARSTGFASESFDFITSTNTLEHIPPQDIKAILRECHRILRAEGLMSFRIDYHDHYADFDPSISPYNFLLYSDSRWRFFSPALHYQNRLRHKDYIALAQEEGFEVVDEKRQEGTQTDLEVIARMSLSQRFRAYRLDELAVRNALIVLRKRVSC